jgi:hypothetical protein
VACPYFVPTDKWDGGGWMHPSRLPLGGGWLGCCSAPGHEQIQPAESEIREFCNLGYAAKCTRLPVDRQFDAVRFLIVADRDQRLLVSCVGESRHLPVEHRQLEFDASRMEWVSTHSDSRIQKLADCYVQSYLQRRNPSMNS